MWRLYEVGIINIELAKEAVTVKQNARKESLQLSRNALHKNKRASEAEHSNGAEGARS